MKFLSKTTGCLALSLLASVALIGCGGGSTAEPPSPLPLPALAFTPPQESLDLNNYTLVGKYSLPEGSGANLLASEVSAVTYNPDTDTLFMVADNGTSIVQTSKTGQLIDTMTLPADAAKPQGTYFYDPEGLTYVGSGNFVMVEERYRQANFFKYVGGTTLDVSTVKTVKLGTTLGNIGLEGVSYDPATNGFVFVKEKTPMGIFATTIDFAAGTASNGSPTTADSTNLFDPALAGVVDFGDIAALSTRLASTAPDYQHLVVLSQESGKVLKMDRTGKTYSAMDIELAAQHEGITFDKDLNMYVTNELGTAGTAGPELWVYKPTNLATAVGRASNLYLTFSTDVLAGTGSITLTNGASDVRTISVTDTAQVKISGKTVTINPTTDLAAGATYTIQAPAGAFKNSAGTGTVAVTGTSLAFTTVSDITAPTLTSTNPARGATAVPSSRVVLTFNEAVKAGTGTITISNGSDDTRVINANDITQVTISGATVDINPSADLKKGTAYRVLVSATAITDSAGNPFAGLNDALSVNFTTAAPAGPAGPSTLVAGDILFVAANADSPDALAFILMKDITANTEIFFSDRDSLTATNEASFKWTADKAYAKGTVVTIQTDPATADKGSTFGPGGGISPNSETYFAFQGSIASLTATTAGAMTADRYLAAINLGTAGPLDATLQAALNAAGAFIAFTPDDNVKYNGSLDATDLAALRARIANAANWLRNDATAFPVTGGSLFP
ncbi:MAG: SdiA-regulated domain-containing protein [Rhodoferax sp.]|nr:SdiA-regulated domain-containing protein [Rhodoferax sp.]